MGPHWERKKKPHPSSRSRGAQGASPPKTTFQAQGKLLDKTAGSSRSPLRKLGARGWVQGKCGSEFQKEEGFGICNHTAEGRPGPGSLQAGRGMVHEHLEREGGWSGSQHGLAMTSAAGQLKPRVL